MSDAHAVAETYGRLLAAMYPDVRATGDALVAAQSIVSQIVEIRAAEAVGVACAFTNLRRELRGVNKALREKMIRVRELEAIDRDPMGIWANESLAALQVETKRLLKERAELRRDLGMREKTINDLRAEARGNVNDVTEQVLERVEDLISADSLVEVLDALSALRLAEARRALEAFERSP